MILGISSKKDLETIQSEMIVLSGALSNLNLPKNKGNRRRSIKSEAICSGMERISWFMCFLFEYSLK